MMSKLSWLMVIMVFYVICSRLAEKGCNACIPALGISLFWMGTHEIKLSRHVHESQNYIFQIQKDGKSFIKRKRKVEKHQTRITSFLWAEHGQSIWFLLIDLVCTFFVCPSALINYLFQNLPLISLKFWPTLLMMGWDQPQEPLNTA